MYLMLIVGAWEEQNTHTHSVVVHTRLGSYMSMQIYSA